MTHYESAELNGIYERSIMENRALVVIDLQNDITKNYREIIGTVNQAIDWASGNSMEVVYIRHHNLSDGTIFSSNS